MHFVCDSRENGRSETKWLWTSTTDEFIDQSRHILEFATSENHNKREISVVGRTGGRLSTNMKKWPENGTRTVKNLDYFPACNAVVMLKIEATKGCTELGSRNKQGQKSNF